MRQTWGCSCSYCERNKNMSKCKMRKEKKNSNCKILLLHSICKMEETKEMVIIPKYTKQETEVLLIKKKTQMDYKASSCWTIKNQLLAGIEPAALALTVCGKMLGWAVFDPVISG